MAVSILERPIGRKIDTENPNTILVDSVSGVRFISVNHYLVTGDFIYVKCPVEDYNGFWYVDVLTSSTFRIRRYATAADQAYVVATTEGAWYKTSSHNWSAVHLPINYRLSSNLWPVNTVDTTRVVSTMVDYYFNTRITLPGALKATIYAGDSLKISGSNVDGVYRILFVTSNTDFVIDLAYNASNTIAGANAVFYYSNYSVNIEVWAGIGASHALTAVDPIAKITELTFIPDSTGLVILNVAEHVKEKIDVNANNLTGGYLPNNLDAWTNFYIKTAETYDVSDGTTITKTTTSFTSDSGNFEGFAINACMPFKSAEYGWLSKYVPSGAMPAKWLTNFESPRLWANKYFDISHINEAACFIRLTRFLRGVQQSQTDTAISANKGVYRFPVAKTGSEDSITLVKIGTEPVTVQTYSAWSNQGSGTSWVGAPNWNVTLAPASLSKYIVGTFSGTEGTECLIAMTYTPQPDVLLTVGFMDSSYNVLGSLTSTPAGTLNGSSITVPEGAVNIYLCAEYTGGVSGAATVTAFSLTPQNRELSETITINVDAECTDYEYYITWLNQLGGLEYFNFTARKKFAVDVLKSEEYTVNTFANWPKSFGEFASKMDIVSRRVSKNNTIISSQFLSDQELESIKYILSSILVEQINSIYDKRVILVDKSNYPIKRNAQDLLTISFNVSDTDTIAVQSL